MCLSNVLSVCSDYCVSHRFAEENSFSYEQTSAFFSIVKATHHKCIGRHCCDVFHIMKLTWCVILLETPYDSMQETYEFFKSLLLCHSVKVCGVYADVLFEC